jgi:D-aminopeptidase
MIAWERYIDSTRDQADGLYRRMSRRTAFADGAEAAYGFGLARGDAYGRASTGHGGALRGWRSHRLHLAKERLSVVVLFNHLSDAYQAAMDVLGAVLGVERPKRRPAPTTSSLFGPYIETETGLSVRIGPAADGAVQLRYGQFPERLDLDDGGGAYGEAVVIEPRAEGLVMQRSKDNLRTVLQPLEAAAPRFDVAGRWRCEELEAELAVVDAGGALYGAFSGWLGQGRMELLTPVGVDVWVLPCVRALDHTPPGDFTLRARRGGEGEISTLEVGCWLARGLRYERRD